MQRSLTIIFFLTLMCSGYSQEFLIDAAGIKANESFSINKKKAELTEPLLLPIFDDFSYYSNKPDESIWINGGVYVNYSYPVGPPSAGVATFDAVDLQGNFYEGLGTSPRKSDSLRTRNIQLDIDLINSTYLSFYYQPQGHGNAPEFNDSLVLRLITENTDTVIWRAYGCDYSTFNRDSLSSNPELVDTSLNFKLVHLPLSDSIFYLSTIQLQFENYVSLAGDHAPSAKTNADHWHIDYFNIRNGVSAADTFFNDIAMVQPFDFFLSKYTTVPWSHYDDLIDQELAHAYTYIRNLSNTTSSLEYIKLFVYNESDIAIDSFASQNTIDFAPHSMDDGWTWKTLSPVNYNNNNNAQFLFEGRIFPKEGSDTNTNNSVYRYFNFANCYARDDGSAEKAYGLDVNGAQVAYKYKTYKRDTLKGIQFHFEKNQDPENVVSGFKLCVWESGSGDEPGELILLQEENDPEFTDKLNGFVTLVFDEPIPVDNEFFIGWEQTSDLMMNVGFDANTRSNNNRLYYRVYDNWYKSAYNGAGALMMRPVFADVNNTHIDARKSHNIFTLYPNPTNGILKIDSDSGAGSLELYNAQGSLLYRSAMMETSINLSEYNDGIYLLKITDASGTEELHKVLLSK